MVGAQINHSQIEEYAQRVAEILGDQHFSSHETINGQEILRLSDVKQVNFFVLKNLFEKWQEETRNLRSPYFNFKKEKVTKALVAFMNTLSQNIEMEKAAFMPLLTSAIQDTLYITLTPFDHFWVDISQGPEVLSIKNLKAKGKYIKQNKHIYDAFIENVLLATDDKIDKSDARTLLESLIQDGKLQEEDNEKVIEGLAKIHPLDMEVLYAQPESEDEPLQEPESDEDVLNDLFDEDTLVESDGDDFIAITQEADPEIGPPEESVVEPTEVEEVVDEKPAAEEEFIQDEVIEEEASSVMNETEEERSLPNDPYQSDQEVEDTIVEEEPPVEEEELPAPRKLVRKRPEPEDTSDSEESLNTKYTRDKTTINDQLKDDDKVTIADIHETQPTGKMQESISVNQRYMFVNELFSGNVDQYNKAINDIERCESFDDSVELMIQKYAKKLDWNMNSPEVKELLKVIFKRYR